MLSNVEAVLLQDVQVQVMPLFSSYVIRWRRASFIHVHLLQNGSLQFEQWMFIDVNIAASHFVHIVGDSSGLTLFLSRTSSELVVVVGFRSWYH